MLTSHNRATTLAAALVCSSLVATPTSGDKIKRTVPLSAAAWTVDLRPYGYVDNSGTPKIRLSTFHTADLFANNEELISTFVTREPVEGLQRRDDPYHQFPYKLHAVVFDAASGKALGNSSWGSDYQTIGLVMRDDGSFAAFLGDHIDFYSADLKPQKEIKLPEVADLAGQENRLAFSSSPSGRTMLIQYDRGQGSECLWLSSEARSTSGHGCQPPLRMPDFALVFGAAVSDEAVVSASATGRDTGSLHLGIQEFRGASRKLCDCPNCYLALFVAEDTLAVWQGSSIWLLREDGKTVWRQNTARALGYILNYAQGPGLLALPLQDYRGPTILSAVVVYDVSKRKSVFRVNTDARDNRLQGLAVSPDGSRLAIDIGGVLRCYVLPPKAE